MKFELVNKHKVFIDIEMSDIITHMTELPLIERWAAINQIFKECKFDDLDGLTDGQKIAILNFLETNYKLYKFGKPIK